MTVSESVRSPAAGAARRGHHPGLALAVIAGAQLMVVLDATIVNIALPHIQQALHFSTTSLSWVLNAYTLTFGGLLLLGGRAGDILGRRRVFIAGILLFTLASLLGGLASSEAWLLAARALQGVGGAIASPTALALITTNFAEGPERNRAFGVFAAVSGSGAAVGLIAGGALTSRAGMAALVYGFIRAAQEGWRDAGTVGSFAAAVILLATFFLIERRTRQPITPLHMFGNRNRAGSYAVMLALAAALFGMFFFLTLFVQNVLGYSPLRAGFAFLPVTAALIFTAQFASRTLPKFGPKPLMTTGAVLAVVGLAWVSQISATSGYLDGILGPMLIFGLGMGLLFVPLTIVAVSGVDRHESGAASSLLNVMQQVGGSLGLSILVTVFGTASRNEAKTQVARFFADATPQLRAQFAQTGQLPAPYAGNVLAHGISTAFLLAVAFAALALVVSVVVIRARASDVDASAVPGMGG